MQPSTSEPRVVLVTGASRGIGAAVAHQLSDPETHVISGPEPADESEVNAMIDDVAERFGRLNVLILNASGGSERDADLARLALPLMADGGRIVFVTSHQAHFYPHVPMLAEYVPIAEGKRAGERALRDMAAEFERHGVKLLVVSGDMIGRRRDRAVDEFASTIVSTALARDLLADTVYVGGPDYLASRQDKVVAW
jgi:NAD(P)-dependent dehydrogenase (short-subunit alcohol dehydrogenase family)